MRTAIFWMLVGLLIAWAIGFGGYGYLLDDTLANARDLSPDRHFLIRISICLVWIGGMLFFGLLSLALKPAKD